MFLGMISFLLCIYCLYMYSSNSQMEEVPHHGQEGIINQGGLKTNFM